MESPTPNELKRLQLLTGLTRKELAERLGLSLKSWDNLTSVNSKKKILDVRYEILLILAGEHPEFELKRRS
ncbi:hypothetical protein U0D24_21620 [Hafnia paralvei]|jgi:transcriptional regulator with XRE-family HTH domain|uniref:hypothetical protein n=1 Tax=Hafnia paralvei TaxID=546367 RepID=UPI002FDB9BD1